MKVELSTKVVHTNSKIKNDIMKEEIWKDIEGFEGLYQVSFMFLKEGDNMEFDDLLDRLWGFDFE